MNLVGFIVFLMPCFSFGLSFNEALSVLENRDQLILVKKAEVRKAQAELWSSRSLFFPALYAKGVETQKNDATYSRTKLGTLGGKINLFHGGSDWASINSSRASLESEKSQLTETILTRELKNLEYLVNYVKADLQVKVAKNIFQLNQSLEEIQQARYQKGLIPLQEAQKATIEKSNSEAKLRDAENSFSAASAVLRSELGSLDVTSDTWPWTSFLTPNLAAAWLKKDFKVQQVPSWKSAQESLEAQDQSERAKFRDFLPSLDLSVDYGYFDYESRKDTGWLTTLTLTVPLMDLKQHADYRVQVAQKSIAQKQLEVARRNAEADFEQGSARLQTSLQTAAHREKSRQMALSLYEDTQRRLRAGRSSLNDTLVDQSRLAEAEYLTITGWAEAHLQYARFCHALGMRLNPSQFGCLPVVAE
ncbi:MAG: TolC family protein [Bdellovibrionales bacterium]